MALYLYYTTTPFSALLYLVPPQNAIETYYKTNSKSYTDSTGKTISALDNYNNTVGLAAPGSYIDYITGVIFTQENGTDGNSYLYPLGIALSNDALKVIQDQFGNPVVSVNDSKITLSPFVPSASPAAGSITK